MLTERFSMSYLLDHSSIDLHTSVSQQEGSEGADNFVVFSGSNKSHL